MDDLNILKLDLIFDKLSQMPENIIVSIEINVNFDLKTKFLNGDIFDLTIPVDINKFNINTVRCSYVLMSKTHVCTGYDTLDLIIEKINSIYGK